MLNFGYRLYPSYNGYSGAVGKGIENVMGLWLRTMTKCMWYLLKGDCGAPPGNRPPYVARE
jgi:hypothetical protein